MRHFSPAATLVVSKHVPCRLFCTIEKKRASWSTLYLQAAAREGGRDWPQSL